MKIITYNVLDGFENEVSRKEACAQWIKTQNPDIVFLNELNHFTPETLQSFASVWGHSHSVLLMGRSAYRIAITSKKPITNVELYFQNLQGHGLIIAESIGLTLMTNHLNPHSIKKRHHDIDFIITKINECNAANKNIIFGGDLNSLFIGEKHFYQDDINQMRLWAKQKTIEKPAIENLENGDFDFALTQKLLDSGMIDLLSKHATQYQRSYLTKLRLSQLQADLSVKQANLNPEKLHSRIDYLWANPTLANTCTSCSVPNDPKLEELSDHFPVVATFS